MIFGKIQGINLSSFLEQYFFYPQTIAAQRIDNFNFTFRGVVDHFKFIYIALIPLFFVNFKKILFEKNYYENIKTVLVIHNLDEYSEVSRADFKKAEVPIHSSLKGKMLNVYDVASYEADAIIIFDKPSATISKELLNQPGLKANKKKISVIKWADDEVPDYSAIAEKMDKVLEKLSD